MKGESALRGRQEGGWVKNLTRGYSQAWIFHQHYLISEESDTHKWPVPFRSCFTWGLVKIVFPQKRVLKHLLSGLQKLQDFEDREIFLPNKGVGHSGITRNWWGNICPSQQQRHAQVNIFLIVFPVALKIVQAWEEKALE